jgi:acetate kinase
MLARTRTQAAPGPAEAFAAAFALLNEQALPDATVIGHRVVHGGQAHVSPKRVDEALLTSLTRLVPLAPLHLPAGIEGMRAALAQLPRVPHIACFDTAFHAELPERAARYPLPGELYAQGVRRYGFHGLSYEYVLSTLGAFPPNRVIIAHLGNGASVVAVNEGRSIDTTMGLTPRHHDGERARATWIPGCSCTCSVKRVIRRLSWSTWSTISLGC